MAKREKEVEKSLKRKHSDSLADVIKGVHKKLKQEYLKSEKDYTSVWQEHSKDRQTLQKYAEAMHELATQHWSVGSENRIEWTHKTCQEYFRQGGMQKHLDKDARRRIHTKDLEPNLGEYDKVTLNSSLKLLDVGSCYNPFSDYNDYNVTAIDLQPAKESKNVYESDFLQVEIKKEISISSDKLDALSSDFDIVVFSLLLEYFPSPSQRFDCVVRAWKLMKFYGLLVIITPDSHKQHRGAKRMKEWKIAIESIGFHRVKYEKLEHLHCMAFRKIPTVLEPSKDMTANLTVPQDFNTEISDEETEDNNSSKHLSPATNKSTDENPFV